MIALLVSGTFFSLATTALTVTLLFNRRAPPARAAPPLPDKALEAARAASATAASEPPAAGVPVKPMEKVKPRTSPVLLGALAAGVASAALIAAARALALGPALDAVAYKLLVLSTAVATLQFGKTLDPRVRAFCPAIVTCSALTSAAVAALGALLYNQHWKQALAGFRTATGGVLGGTGVGDLIFAMASPAVAALPGPAASHPARTRCASALVRRR